MSNLLKAKLLEADIFFLQKELQQYPPRSSTEAVGSEEELVNIHTPCIVLLHKSCVLYCFCA